MDDFGTISSIESLPVPEGPHVKDFDAVQRAAKIAARAAKKAAPPSAVTRQMSPNLALPAITPPTFQSVADFVEAYKTTDKTIADLTAKFVEAADVAKQKHDDILPHLAYMQSLLSKKGSNHHLVVEARKRGERVPWWTQYYNAYKNKAWESLRTMERRIAAYRKDPNVRPTKPGSGTGGDKPKHLTRLEHKLLGTATSVHEALTDINAGRVDDAVKKLKENLPTQDRIEEYLERGVNPALANPDGHAKAQADSSEQQQGSEEPIEPSLTLPASAPVPQTATYEEWKNHQLPAPDYKRKYFREASQNFTVRYRHALQSSTFEKILDMLKDKPQQVLANAHDFAQLAVVLRGAAENLNLLAATITTALTYPTEAEPGTEPAPEPEEQQEEQNTEQHESDPTVFSNEEAESQESGSEPQESEPVTVAPTKVQQAESWLLRYLKNGPMPISPGCK